MTQPTTASVGLPVFFRRLRLAASLVGVSALWGASAAPSLLERIQHQGTLVFYSTNGPDTMYEGHEGYLGFEYALIQRFSQYLGVKADIQQPGDSQAILLELQRHPNAIGAAGLAVPAQGYPQLAFGPQYRSSKTWVIVHAGDAPPLDIGALLGTTLLVQAHSPQEAALLQFQKHHPQLRWLALPLDADDLQERVHLQAGAVAVVDADLFQQNAAFFPNARMAFELTPGTPIAWAFAKQQDPSLNQAVQRFFNDLNNSGELAQLWEASQPLPPPPEAALPLFIEEAETHLGRWETALQQAAERYALDWQLLAAIGYQESRWNAKAVSETGVQGFMMLTQATAKEMKVANRLDAKQSIQGGAKLLRYLLDALPDSLPLDEKLPQALVAYNLGLGHLEDARKLASKQGKNPNDWQQLKTLLPLLNKPSVYGQLRHGYANGRAAVHYAETILANTGLLAEHRARSERLLLAEASKPNPHAGVDISPQLTQALRGIGGG